MKITKTINNGTKIDRKKGNDQRPSFLTMSDKEFKKYGEALKNNVDMVPVTNVPRAMRKKMQKDGVVAMTAEQTVQDFISKLSVDSIKLKF